MSRRRVAALPALSLAVDEACTDLLLLEEFYTSDAFCSWFLEQTVGPEWSGAAVREVGRSVVRYGRESDLEVAFEAPDGRTLRLLIENKIKASFQPGQVEEYANRARRYVESGRCDVARTVLVAPRIYGAADRFDHAVEYEAIRDWYMLRKSARDRYRARVFESGINKAEGKTYSEPDLKVTEFWRRYYLLACEEAPELRMREPGNRAANSTFIEFNDAELPPRVLLVHKMQMPQGFVDLQLRGMGKHVDEVRRHFGAHLPAGARIERAHGSAVIRVDVPAVSVWDDFDAQLDAIRSCQRAAVSLLDWVRSDPRLWSEWQVRMLAGSTPTPETTVA